MIAAALLVLAMTAPASALECKTRKGDDGYYAWRMIDNKKCYYRGARGLSKRWLSWSERPAGPKPEFRKAPEPVTWPVLAEATRALPLEDLPAATAAEPFVARFSAAYVTGQIAPAPAPVFVPPPLPLPRPPDVPRLPATLALLALLGLARRQP